MHPIKGGEVIGHRTCQDLCQEPAALRRWPYLEVQGSLVGQIRLVPCQSYYDVGAGLSLKLFDPVLRPHKRLLPNQRRSHCDTKFNNNEIHTGLCEGED